MTSPHIRFAALFVLLLPCSFAFSTPALARDDGQEDEAEVDMLSLGARLVADGHYDRALSVLRGVPADDDQVDRAKLHFLFATIYLKRELYAEARDALKRSIAAGQPNEAIYVYLAQAHFQLKEYRQAITALDAAPETALESPGTFSMRAEAHWKLKETQKAIDTLDAGRERFPKFKKLAQMKIGYLIELGLYKEVTRVGQTYLAEPGVEAGDFVAVAEGLRRSKQLIDAQRVLEQARLRFPDDVDLTLQLGNIYNDLGDALSAAMLYEQASYRDDRYSFEAAELYKHAGRFTRALSLNARTLDADKKLKQRLAILLDMQRFELIAAMEASLSRTGLLKDESIRYALAYGHFKRGDFPTAERHLKLLSDPALFEKAVALRKAMATCREAGWACY